MVGEHATRFAVRVPSGRVEVTLRDGLDAGRWLFELPAPGELVIDYLEPQLCSIAGIRPVALELPEPFIPTPRLRLQINGSTHEFVSTDPRVLQRHYERSHHQEVAYSRPDPWTRGYHLARVRQARRLLRGVSGRVCDVGSGYSLVSMAGPWNFELSACDRDPEAVAALRSQGVHAVVGAADDPPFADDYFDAVYAGEIVEHLAEPNAALQRWVRLLRRGGRLIVTTPNRSHLLTRARGYALIENPEHVFEWDLAELRGAVRKTGAVVTRIEGLGLPLPVLVPGRGWRDAAAALTRRARVPSRVVSGFMDAGRLAPSLAVNLAVVARRVS